MTESIDYAKALLGPVGFAKPFTPAPEDEPYYAAIGRFIVQYAACEGAVHMLARRLSKIKDDRARLLFGGMRTGDVIDRIRAMWRFRKHSAASTQELESCLSHYDVMGTCRDKIAHRFTSYKSGSILVSNLLTAKNLVHAEQDIFSLEDLTNLYSDCIRLYLRFEDIYQAKWMKSPHDAMMRKIVRIAWRYTPPAPKNEKRRSRRSRRSREHQRQS